MKHITLADVKIIISVKIKFVNFFFYLPRLLTLQEKIEKHRALTQPHGGRGAGRASAGWGLREQEQGGRLEE